MPFHLYKLTENRIHKKFSLIIHVVISETSVRLYSITLTVVLRLNESFEFYFELKDENENLLLNYMIYLLLVNK